MLFWLILLPILAAMINTVFWKQDTRVFFVALQSIIFLLAAAVFYSVRTEGIIIENLGNFPNRMAITLVADYETSTFVLLTSVLFILFLLYTYLENHFTTQFGFLFLLLEACIIGLFLSYDLFNIYILLEVSTVLVSLLIMFNKDQQAIYDGMMYFFINVIASSFMLFGIGFLYNTFGVLDIRAIKEGMSFIENTASVIIPFSFMMTTVGVKIALFPLYGWLPRAYSTPSAPPVVPAILSGLYEAAGVYLFVRLIDMFSPALQANWMFAIIGFVTGVAGFVLAFCQNDANLVFAYSTMSQLGLILIGLTMGPDDAFYGGLFHLFSHSLFKSTLFLSTGILYKEYGTRNIQSIHGVMKKLPLTGFGITAGLLGITGAPLFNGSISKYMISYGSEEMLFQYGLNLINLGTVIYCIKFAAILFGTPVENSKVTNRWSLPQVIVSFLGLLTLLTGIFGRQAIDLFYGYIVSIDASAYIEKGIVYFLMILAGTGFYRGLLKQNRYIEKINHIEITFNGSITFMTSFFILLVAVLLSIF